MMWHLNTTLILVLVSLAWTQGENVTLSGEDEEDQGEDFSSLDELELELEEQPPAIRRGTGHRLGIGWSEWSEWSTCSRSCDGGASYQLRRCKSSSGCRGEAVRYKICNMQPCPETGEFRDQQCSAYSEIPYDGTELQWSPHYEDSEPCALTCRGRIPGSEESEEVVVQLAEKVQDGTRCRPGSLDMCINGKCQRVGCDLRIGSLKKVDECGVCGGDGSSCAQPLYHWEEAPSSLCSITCGGGYKMSRPVCRSRVSGLEVQEQLCDSSQRPDPKLVECNTHRCPAKWAVEDWSPCSVTCGSGTRFRPVHCAQEGNGTRVKVPEHLCHGHKPRYQEPCSDLDCPVWSTGQWSGCSVSCGEGVQTRVVHCKDIRGSPSSMCETAFKPSVMQGCRTGIPCPAHRPPFYDSGGMSIEHLSGQGHTQPLVQPYPPPRPAPSSATAERLVGQQIVPSEATFIAENWGPCSASCGEGVRQREVHCKIFLEFSRTNARLPDQQCQGPKPPTTESCVVDLACPIENRFDQVGLRDGYGEPYPSETFRTHYSDTAIKVAPGSSGKTYSWKEQGFTHCSASCLGGVQESLITCLRDNDQKAVSPYLCPQEARPEILTRTCNDHPCPPRWNYSDFQPCTKSCGIGIQTREVNCIHEVTRGGSNTVIVPNSMCPQPPPLDRQYCNVLDCPIRWHTSEWSKCSKTCGGGVKTRLVECKQVMAQNHVVQRPASKCPSTKPPDKKPCNTKSCVLESERPHIAASNTSYVQQNPSKKKVTLKIGGQAVVFWGTQIKIKCPVKRFNRTKIQWAKDHNYISNSKKYKISKKGALRIQDVTHRDSGIYTCVAGLSTANLMLSVKPRPGEFLSSEEIERQNTNRVPEHTGLDDPNIESQGPSQDDRRSFLPAVDDLSHELRPPGDVNPQSLLPKQNKIKLRPTPPLTPPAQSSEEDELTNPSILPAAVGGAAAAEPATSPPHLFDSLGDPPVPTSSGGSRPLPHFQQLLANLQTFGQSRGHRMVTEVLEQDHNHTDEVDDDEDSEEDSIGPIIILGKGKPENLKFDWMITEWSRCSQTCGGSGFQMRAAHCMVRLHNTTQNVDSNLCEDAGLVTPPTIQKCGVDDCPRWVPTNWSTCEDSRCFTWNTAMQRREITCQLSNGTDVELQLCSETEKPPQRQECYNDKCKGTWKVGEWSECAAPCEAQGIKYRILQCVWFGTKKPAGNACRDQPRPSVMKVCKGPPCAQMSECKDQSKYCQNVKAMNMCRVHRYQYQCCQSCRNKG